MDSATIIVAWAASGRTIPVIGLGCHIRIEPWRVVSKAEPGSVEARDSKARQDSVGPKPLAAETPLQAGRQRLRRDISRRPRSAVPAAVAPLAGSKMEA